ncbi:Acg family FMN-binding oxidoreductase [Nocardia brasiliensis]|uniref:Nitroreductase domain-containing protein n=1 Tax=Nocardia brasiliensis (strain ATCC 700358 / HUJEG-1) TaxID=1133849 RepID=K0EWX6_NOCB7|nr:hypothetical protein [Nocardia brasiliensis]AFU01589.1 hypothetical protein O3I_018150 [Nocardia brasiliensis ATCC 700358]OCF85833.1 hypothetical protein AW168_33820 [Nocardia brasiliensis]
MTVPDGSTTPSLSVVRTALALACRAPSVHNTQPWHWVFDGSKLLLYRDTTRQLPAGDPQYRQSIISCGAALDHARQAFVSMGWFAHITRIPQPGCPELLAALRFRPWSGPLNRTAARVRAIPRRHTDRLPMLPPDHWPDVLATARELARPHQVVVDEITDGDRPRLAEATRHITALRRYDTAYQDELHWWSGSSESRGIPASALTSSAEAARTPVGRAFPFAPYANRRSGLEDRSRLLLLSSVGDSFTQWLHTGEALSNILLECTARGLATCELTHLTELTATRSVLAELLSRPGAAQVVVRVGNAPDDTTVTASPRRPLSEVFDFQPEHPRNRTRDLMM